MAGALVEDAALTSLSSSSSARNACVTRDCLGSRNSDNDRMVPSVLSEDLHRRIKNSELIIYPDSGHGGIFQFHDKFVPVALEFLARSLPEEVT